MENIICSIFGHKYRLLRTITKDIREAKCERCSKEFAMHDLHKTLLPLDDELREANTWLLNYETEKLNRKDNEQLPANGQNL